MAADAHSPRDDHRLQCSPLLSAARRAVLLQHAGRDAAALTDRDAVLLRPGPDIPGALTARRGPRWPPRLPPPGFAGVFDEWRELLAERFRVLLAQVDLILGPAEGEPDGLIGRTATEVVFQRDDYSLCHFNLHDGAGVLAPYWLGVTDHRCNAASHTQCSRKVIIVRGFECPSSLSPAHPTGSSHSVSVFIGRMRGVYRVGEPPLP